MSTLLVCSGGGHLKQLYRARRRASASLAPPVWVDVRQWLSRCSSPTERSSSRLSSAAARCREHRPHPFLAFRMLRSRRFDRRCQYRISPAVRVLPHAAAWEQAHYIESAARCRRSVDDGRTLVRVRRILNLYTQYPAWADDRVALSGVVFDEFVAGRGACSPCAGAGCQVVSRSAPSGGYRFDRLLQVARGAADGLRSRCSGRPARRMSRASASTGGRAFRTAS